LLLRGLGDRRASDERDKRYRGDGTTMLHAPNRLTECAIPAFILAAFSGGTNDDV
jgi:hypothetical protein